MGAMPVRIVITLAVLATVLGFLIATTAGASMGAPAVTRATDTTTGEDRTELERETGLSMKIDAIRPAAIRPDEPLRLRGDVINQGSTRWDDAKVYLDIATTPTTTKTDLDAFDDDDDFGERIVTIGLFDEIGDLRRASTKSFRLRIPFDELGLSGELGVYRVGVRVIAGDDTGRDVRARSDTWLPLQPDQNRPVAPTRIVTLVPVTFPIIRHDSGNFVDERLASALSRGGQLRNLLDFVLNAPADSLQIVADPALLQAVRDMADGYVVTTFEQESDDATTGSDGTGVEDADVWIRDFDRVTASQTLFLTAWQLPDASAYARAQLPIVVDAAIDASGGYALDRRLLAPLVHWQLGGGSTRRGLVVARSAGADIEIVSTDSLPNLGPVAESSYPPSIIDVPTSQGSLTATVYARSIAGAELDLDMSALAFRQHLMAEATVRMLDAERGDPTAAGPWVLATPFGWDPGPAADSVDLDAGYGFRPLRPVDLALARLSSPVPYQGPIEPSRTQASPPSELVSAVRRLRQQGTTITDLLTDKVAATDSFEQRLASAGTSQWVTRSKLRLALIRRSARLASEALSQVTVTGPTFVALSSESGRFPLTVTNGLDTAITVAIRVRPDNPALRIDPLEPLQLEPQDSVDIEVRTSSDRSGVTAVRVRLTTVRDRAFGEPYEFDVRATQIGAAIWVVIAVGSGIVLVAAAVQITRRIRTTGLTPREKPSP